MWTTRIHWYEKRQGRLSPYTWRDEIKRFGAWDPLKMGIEVENPRKYSQPAGSTVWKGRWMDDDQITSSGSDFLGGKIRNEYVLSDCDLNNVIRMKEGGNRGM